MKGRKLNHIKKRIIIIIRQNREYYEKKFRHEAIQLENDKR